jgi:hypothetical protein
MKEKKAQSIKMRDMSKESDLKSGFSASKPKIDAFKGKPAKINKKNEYVCEDDDQVADYEQKGLKAVKKEN